MTHSNLVVAPAPTSLVHTCTGVLPHYLVVNLLSCILFYPITIWKGIDRFIKSRVLATYDITSLAVH